MAYLAIIWIVFGLLTTVWLVWESFTAPLEES